MNQRIKLTESDLHRIIKESINQVLMEDEMDENWFGDKWNQTKSAVKTLANNGNGESSLSDRWTRAKKNWGN